MQKLMPRALLKTTLALVTGLVLLGSTHANTQIINAQIESVEPIYMNYTLKKVIQPCQTYSPNCYRVSYQQNTSKSLAGYRIKLSYEGREFTTRMSKQPNTGEMLNIRVRSDLLDEPSSVAINAAVAY